jgi:small subunit ribosomal protein S1
VGEEASDLQAALADETSIGQPVARVDVRAVDLEQEELEAALGEMSLDRMLMGQDQDEEQLAPDTRRRGTVVKVDAEYVFVALGGQHEGLVPRRQFPAPPELGQQVEVLVARFSPDDGLYEVTLPGAAVDVDDWSDLEEGMVVEARITGHNPGGLECEVNHLRGFIPASQVSLYRVEDLSSYTGQKLACVVTEANPRRRNLVLSHRAVLEREREEKRRKLLEELEPGQIREGVVRSLRDFGAFVDLGGLDGLVPLGQLSWERIEHPRDVLQEGQRVRVRVDRVDPQSGKVSLSYRDLLEHPWTDIEQRFSPGAIVPAVVTKIMEFGAFARVATGVEGLIHVSELAHRRVQRVSQVVQEGDEVQVKILAVDAENQRMSLSIKAVQAVAAEPAEQEESAEQPEPPVVKPQGPLKGGTDRKTGGEQFGLRW